MLVSAVTFQVVRGPGAKLTGPAGVLVKHILILLTRRARPTAAHLTFPYHLRGGETGVGRTSMSANTAKGITGLFSQGGMNNVGQSLHDAPFLTKVSVRCLCILIKSLSLV